MNENKVTQTSSSDDIDLLGVLERIYLYFLRFKNLFLIAIVVGVLLGSLQYFTSTKIYQSKLILHSSYLTNQEEIEIIDYWNQLLQRKEHHILAPILNCSEELLHNVLSLEAAQILKNYSASDPNGFYINVKVRDNTILPQLQTAIIDGLSSTAYAQQRVSARQKDLQGLISQSVTEIKRLDSLKANIESGVEKNAIASLFNVESINKDLFDLNEKLAGYKTDLNFLSAVQLLQGFIPLNTPVSTSLKVSILIAVIFCIAIAYIYSLIKYIEGRLKERVKPNARE